jgi:hypothetical protein
MKRLLFFTLVVASAALPWGITGQSQQVPPELKGRQFMHRKLEHSQKVLEGIVVEDFDLIEKNARNLNLLSQAAEWQILPSAEYRGHSEEFRRTTETLAKAAREKNLDGAALAYVQLTLNCVNCHKYVRTFPLDERRKPVTADEKPDAQRKDGQKP